MVQQYLIQIASDLWDIRACLVSGKQPKKRTRHFRKGETFYVFIVGRVRGIHTSFSAARLGETSRRGPRHRLSHHSPSYAGTLQCQGLCVSRMLH